MTRTVTTVRRTTPSVWPHRIRQPSIYPTKHNNDSYQSRDEPPVAWSSIAARGPRVDRHSPFTRQVRGQTRGGGGREKGRGEGRGVVYVRVRVICVGPRVFSGAIGISILRCGAVTPANRLGSLCCVVQGRGGCGCITAVYCFLVYGG